MNYFIRSWGKFHFIITPDELRSVLLTVHQISCNGVKKGYIENNPDVLYDKYISLYNKLKCGEKLIWEKDYKIATFSTGITGHLDNCCYKPTTKLCIPDFIEPCILLDTFCFLLWKDQLSTAFSPIQFPENVVGLNLSFPTKVEFVKPTAKRNTGIVLGDDLDDYETYQTIISHIKSITSPLKLQINGKQYRPSVRISNQARKDFTNFYFVTQNDTKIL